MRTDALLSAVSAILDWDFGHSKEKPPLWESARIAVTGRHGVVAIERVAANLFRVTTADKALTTIYRSRFTSSLEEAAKLFGDTVWAETIGYNMGGDQAEFEAQFDPAPDAPAFNVKDPMQMAVESCERKARFYLERAEEMRRLYRNAEAGPPSSRT